MSEFTTNNKTKIWAEQSAHTIHIIGMCRSLDYVRVHLYRFSVVLTNFFTVAQSNWLASFCYFASWERREGQFKINEYDFHILIDKIKHSDNNKQTVESACQKIYKTVGSHLSAHYTGVQWCHISKQKLF